MIITQNIFLIGPVGAGKSTIGGQLAKALKLEFFDTDREIEQRCGVAIDWIFDIEGEDGFRQREKQVIDELARRQNIVLATGGGAVVLPENRTLLSSRGKVVYLEASIEQQLERTATNKRRPLLQVDDKEAQLRKLMAEREALYQEIADITIATGRTTVRNVVHQISEMMIQESV